MLLYQGFTCPIKCLGDSCKKQALHLSVRSVERLGSKFICSQGCSQLALFS